MERIIWRKEWVFLVVFMLALFLRVYYIDHESLWLDEGFSVTFASSSPAEILKISANDAHPPLYYIILHYWMNIFGNSEFSVRALSALFGILAVYIIYKIGVILFDIEVGLISSLILGFSSFHLYYSQEVRSYALVVLLTLISFYYLSRLKNSQNSALSIGYTISSALLLYTHMVPGFIVLATQNFYVLSNFLFFRKKSSFTFRHWILLQIGVVALFSPWIVVVLIKMTKIQNQIAWIPRPSINYTISCLKQFAGSGPLLLVFSGFAAFSIINFDFKKVAGRAATGKTKTGYKGFWRILSLNTSDSIYVSLIWFVAPIFLLYAISMAAKPIFLPRIAIPAMLGFFILAAKGIRNLKNKYLIIIVLLVISVFSAKSLKAYYFYSHKEEWRQVAQFIDAKAGKKDLALFNSGTCLRVVYNYYSKNNEYKKMEFPENGKIVDDENIKELKPLMENFPNIWLILSHSGDRDGLIIKNLEKNYKLEKFKKFWGIDVYFFKQEITSQQHPGPPQAAFSFPLIQT